LFITFLLLFETVASPVNAKVEDREVNPENPKIGK
jgi:hypothetical protein